VVVNSYLGPSAKLDESEACRVRMSRGIVGRGSRAFRTFLRVDIEKTASLTVYEPDEGMVHYARWTLRSAGRLGLEAAPKAEGTLRGHPGERPRPHQSCRSSRLTADRNSSAISAAPQFTVSNNAGRRLRSILRICGQSGGRRGGFVGQWLYEHRRREPVEIRRHMPGPHV
jgi:hypothetical protein